MRTAEPVLIAVKQNLQSEPISVAFEPTGKDIIRASYLSLRARPVIWALSVGFFVVLPWLAALGGIAASIAGAPVGMFPILILIVVPPLAAGYFALLPLVLVRGARSLQGIHTYEFSETGIRLRGPGFDNHIDWAILTRCYGFDSGLVFVSGKAALFSVPGRTLSPAAKKQLREMLAANGVALAGPWARAGSDHRG
jgi:hypothetical protein